MCVVSPARADSVGVLVNGACEFGTCPPTPLASDMSLNEPFSFTTTLPNGDVFELSGLLTASNSGGGAHALSLPERSPPVTGALELVRSAAHRVCHDFPQNHRPALHRRRVFIDEAAACFVIARVRAIEVAPHLRELFVPINGERLFALIG